MDPGLPFEDMQEKSRRSEYAEATREALVEAGMELFAERGYGHTSTEEIVRRARVTRGALYHHFTGKADLFQAVVERLEELGVQAITEKAFTANDPWEVITLASEAFLDFCLEPKVQRIMLLDAPSVLGWEKWREIDVRHSLGLTQEALQAAMDAGAIEQQPPEPLAHMVLGAMHNAAHYIVESEDPQRARAEAGAAFTRFLEGLRKS